MEWWWKILGLTFRKQPSKKADNVLSLSDLCFPHLYKQMIEQNSIYIYIYLLSCLALCLACGQCSDVVFWYLFLLIVIDCHGYVHGGISLKHQLCCVICFSSRGICTTTLEVCTYEIQAVILNLSSFFFVALIGFLKIFT